MDDLKPEAMLAQRVTYPQFVEVLSAMLAIKASSQTPTGSVMASVLLAPSLNEMLQHLPQVHAITTMGTRPQHIVLWRVAWGAVSLTVTATLV